MKITPTSRIMLTPYLTQNLMKELLAFDGDAIEYICNKCRTSQSNQSVTLKSLNASINQMFQTVKGLAEDVGGLVKYRDENSRKIATLEEITTSLSLLKATSL